MCKVSTLGKAAYLKSYYKLDTTAKKIKIVIFIDFKDLIVDFEVI